MNHSFRSGLSVFVVVMAAYAASLAAGPPVSEAAAQPQWQPVRWVDHPVRIELRDRAELEELLRRVPIASFSRENLRVSFAGTIEQIAIEPRVTDAEHAELEAAGYRPVRLRDLDREGREAAEKVWAARDADAAAKTVFTFPLSVYPTHAEVGQILADLAAAHPARARTFQWGTSVQGRQLWGLVISDDVQNTEAEPEVRLSSTMHGDEVTGMILLLDFAHYLLTNYGVAGREDVTNLVNNYEIHLMPSHNPDGTFLGQRANAGGIDLNRNFPLPAGTDPVAATENVAFMNHANSRHFVVSGNYHGGALVVNYPWDYTYTLAPDDAAIIRMSLDYSTYNTPMYNGPFSQGITNGALWYVALGTLQDWSYAQTSCIDVTIEVSATKWPAPGSLVGFWNDNRESLMHFVKAARCGVNGVVTAAGSGIPLAATVTVTGNSKTVATDPAHGDYYKLLNTGTYQLTFSAAGYDPQVISGVTTTWGTPTVLNVQLQPAAFGNISGLVRTNAGAPLAAQIAAYTHPLNAFVASTASAGDGNYLLNGLQYGDYRLVYGAAGYAGAQQIVSLNAAAVAAPTVDLQPAIAVTLFDSDFEDALPDGWDGPWGLVAGGADGTLWSMTDSPVGAYASNLTSACTMVAGTDLSSLLEGTLRFKSKWDIEADWDGCQLQISVGGGAWSPVATANTHDGSGNGVQTAGQPWYEGVQADWMAESVDLAPWLGQTDVRFRFLLRSDSYVTGDGFYFDQLQIEGLVADTLSNSGDVPAATTRLTGVQPNPFNPSTTVHFELAKPAPATLHVYDLSGRLVRTLVNGPLSAGPQQVLWDGTDERGQSAASGVYLVRLKADGVQQTVKAMLVK